MLSTHDSYSNIHQTKMYWFYFEIKLSNRHVEYFIFLNFNHGYYYFHLQDILLYRRSNNIPNILNIPNNMYFVSYNNKIPS